MTEDETANTQKKTETRQKIDIKDNSLKLNHSFMNFLFLLFFCICHNFCFLILRLPFTLFFDFDRRYKYIRYSCCIMLVSTRVLGIDDGM